MTSSALSAATPPGEPSGGTAASACHAGRAARPRFRRVCEGREPAAPDTGACAPAPAVPEQRADSLRGAPPGAGLPVPHQRVPRQQPALPREAGEDTRPAAHPPASDAVAARRRAESVLRIALEVMEGRRPIAHLAPLVTPSVVRYAAAAADSPPRYGPRTATRPALRPRPGAAGLRSLRVVLPRPDAAEITAVCRFRGRVRAVAGRMRLTAEREWRCVALRML